MSEVFSFKQLDAMIIAMQKIIEMIVTPMKFVLTEQEFLDGFIYPEHLPLLKDATKLTGIVAPAGQFYFTARSAVGKELKLMRYSEQSARIMFPNYVNQGLRPDAPVALRERTATWIESRLMLSDAMRDVHGAIHRLNETCGSARAISTVVPCLPLIVSMMYYNEATRSKSESSIKAANKISQAKGSGGLPMMSRDIKQRLQEASSIITTHFALMNEQSSPATPVHGFTCWLASRSSMPMPILGTCSEAY